MVKAAILGYGTVGSGVTEVLSCNQELIAKRAGNPIEVKYILDLSDQGICLLFLYEFALEYHEMHPQ